MHVAIVMISAWGVKTLRSDLIRFLRSGGYRVTVVCAADDAATDLLHLGVSVVNWKVSRIGMNLFREAQSVIRLCHILGNLRPDIILNFTAKVVLYGSLAARSTRNSRVFSVFSGLGSIFGETNVFHTVIRPFLFLLLRISLRNNDLVFFHNPDDQHLLVSKRILPLYRTYRVYGSGVNIRKFVPTRKGCLGVRLPF